MIEEYARNLFSAWHLIEPSSYHQLSGGYIAPHPRYIDRENILTHKNLEEKFLEENHRQPFIKRPCLPWKPVLWSNEIMLYLSARRCWIKPVTCDDDNQKYICDDLIPKNIYSDFENRVTLCKISENQYMAMVYRYPFNGIDIFWTENKQKKSNRNHLWKTMPLLKSESTTFELTETTPPNLLSFIATVPLSSENRNQCQCYLCFYTLNSVTGVMTPKSFIRLSDYGKDSSRRVVFIEDWTILNIFNEKDHNNSILVFRTSALIQHEHESLQNLASLHLFECFPIPHPIKSVFVTHSNMILY